MLCTDVTAYGNMTKFRFFQIEFVLYFFYNDIVEAYRSRLLILSVRVVSRDYTPCDCSARQREEKCFPNAEKQSSNMKSSQTKAMHDHDARRGAIEFIFCGSLICRTELPSSKGVNEFLSFDLFCTFLKLFCRAMFFKTANW